jgi:hypothetical protein
LTRIDEASLRMPCCCSLVLPIMQYGGNETQMNDRRREITMMILARGVHDELI